LGRGNCWNRGWGIADADAGTNTPGNRQDGGQQGFQTRYPAFQGFYLPVQMTQPVRRADGGIIRSAHLSFIGAVVRAWVIPQLRA
jgi:hypothetical protein